MQIVCFVSNAKASVGPSIGQNALTNKKTCCLELRCERDVLVANVNKLSTFLLIAPVLLS